MFWTDHVATCFDSFTSLQKHCNEGRSCLPERANQTTADKTVKMLPTWLRGLRKLKNLRICVLQLEFNEATVNVDLAHAAFPPFRFLAFLEHGLHGRGSWECTWAFLFWFEWLRRYWDWTCGNAAIMHPQLLSFESRLKSMRKVMDRARLEHERWTCAACLCKRLECLMLRVPTCVEAWYDLGIGNVRSALPRLYSIQPVGVHPGSNLVVGICDICSHRWRLQCCLWRVENVCDWQVHMALHHLSGRSQIESVIFVFFFVFWSSMICDVLWLFWTVSEVSDVFGFAWWNTTHELLNQIYCLYTLKN